MTTLKLTKIIPNELVGLRLDQALAQLFPDYSRAKLQNWIRNGQVTVDGKLLRQRDIVYPTQIVIINATLEPQQEWTAQELALDIIFEDEALIVINKPAGLVVHPGAGNRDQTLLNALLHHAPELNTVPRAGIVHRLDKETSGLLVIAKTLPAHTDLVRQLQARTIKREYEAVVRGVLIAGRTIDAPIGRDPHHRTRMAVVESGKPAITHYRILERFRAHTHILVKLETGRTHQIRVHMAHIHHPLVGDPVYKSRLQIPAAMNDTAKQMIRQFPRQALHARRLELAHPLTRDMMGWEASLPEDIKRLLKVLQEDCHQESESGKQKSEKKS